MQHAPAYQVSQFSTAKRVALAREVGFELRKRGQQEKLRQEALALAEALVTDWSQQVREALAFELRHSRKLPKLIACKIACDIDDIAIPFLRVTPALTDAWAAELVPLLSNNAHLALAVRADIGPLTAQEIARHGNANSALTLLGNPSISLTPAFAWALVDAHEKQETVMTALARREDLPVVVASDIISKVGEELRKILCERFDLDDPVAQELADSSVYATIWRQIRHANPAQIHAQVIDLRIRKQVTHELVIEMAERGGLAFMESALALETGKTLIEIREILHLANPLRFVELMHAAHMEESLAPRFLKIAKKHYGAGQTKRRVGTPAMWQSSAPLHPTQGLTDELACAPIH